MSDNESNQVDAAVTPHGNTKEWSQDECDASGLWPHVSQRIEAFFLAHRDKLTLIHIVMFIVFLAILIIPLFLSEPPEDATPWSHFTTFANYVMWGLWFPLVFLSVIFTGRSWCGLMCPMGAASEWGNYRGLKWSIPKWVRWEGTPIISFLVITILGQTLGVRDHPEAIAILFGGTMIAAIIVGLLWGRKRRAWCRHMCPIGLLLGIFSRLGAVEFRPKKKVAGGDRWIEKGPCPTLIDIVRKEESRHCIECFRCVNPKPDKGLRLRLRAPGEEIADIRYHHPNLYEVMFLFIGTGIALGGFLWLVADLYQQWRQTFAIWAIENDLYWLGESGPSWLMAVHPERREVFVWIDFFMIVGFMLLVTVAYTVILSITTATAAWLAGITRGTGSFKQRFTELGYQYAPVAMVSLVIGLGGELFEGFRLIGLGDTTIIASKGAFFIIALLWSLGLGVRILNRRQVQGAAVILPMLPGLSGSLLVGAGWWWAVIGF